MFSNYWIVWPVAITLWAVVGIAEFFAVEFSALRSNDPKKPTLSMVVYTVNTKFPLAMAYGMLLIGILIGTLATHFDWHWCPPGSVSAG